MWKLVDKIFPTKQSVAVDSTASIIEEEIDPSDLTLQNAYQTRWIWYHTILALLLVMVNVTLIGILVTLAIKL